MRYIQINAKLLSELSSNPTGLSGYLSNLYKGREATKRSPLFKTLSPEDILKRWTSILSKRLNKLGLRELLNYELDRRSKFGPQGGLKDFKTRLQDFEEYFEFAQEFPENVQYVSKSRDMVLQLQKSSNKLVKLVGRRDMRPHSYNTVVNKLKHDKKLQTNSGLPDFTKRNRPEVVERALEDAKNGTWIKYPAILGSRSSRQKERFIFMYPMSTNIVESSYVSPLMEAFRTIPVHKSPFLAWEGFDIVNNQFNKIITSINSNTGDGKRAVFISIDYTAMDKHMIYDRIVLAGTYGILPFFQKWCHKDLKNILYHITNIGVLTPIGLIQRHHGMPSGSGWTNTLESIFSYLLHERLIAVLHANGGEYVWNQINGDDGVMIINMPSDVDDKHIAQLISNVAADFGMEANPDKQLISLSEMTYLQRYFSRRDGLQRLVYPTVQALNAMVYPEKFHDPEKWSSNMETLRWIMILENCKDHPLFHEFIDFVRGGDKNKLLLSDLSPEINGKLLEESYRLAKTLPDFVPTYNRAHNDRSILDFETVKYLMRKIKQ